MIEKIKIKKIYFNEKSKAGTAYKDKQGNAYQMTTIYEDGGEGRTLYGRAYPGSDVLSFKVGQFVNLVVDSRADANNKVWHNFRRPKAEEKLAAMVEDMGARLQNLESRIAALEGKEIEKDIEAAPEEPQEEPPF